MDEVGSNRDEGSEVTGGQVDRLATDADVPGVSAGPGNLGGTVGAQADLDDVIEISDSDVFSDEEIEALAVTEGRFRRPSFWPSVAWTILLLAAQIVIGLATVMVTMLVVVANGAQLNPGDPARLAQQVEDAMKDWLLPVASFTTMVVAIVIVVSIYRSQTARCMGLRSMTASQAALVLLAALPMTVLTSEFTNWVSHLFPNMAMPEIFAEFSKQPWWFVFPAACLFPGIGEELYCRGFLSRGLVSRHGVIWGGLFASFLFGAMHIHPVQGAGAFMLGLALQFVFLSTKSLWAAVLLHTLNNSLAFLAMQYGDKLPIDGFTYVSEGEILHTSPWLVLAAMGAVAMILFAMYRIRTEWVSPDGTTWSRAYVTAEGPLPGENAHRVSQPLGSLECLGILVTYGAFLTTAALCVRHPL